MPLFLTRCIGLMIAFGCLLGCGSDGLDIREVGQLEYGGRVERIEILGRYSALETNLLYQFLGPQQKIVVNHDFYLYRVSYPTAGVDGTPTLVSGLVAIPNTRDIRGIVSWQHGTTVSRSNSISAPTLDEGLGVSSLFASAGFIFVATDYIGLGVSTEDHPYYHWPSTVSTVVDLIEIGEIMLNGLSPNSEKKLFISGFSQGGGATAALQNFLEQDNPTELRLLGAAPISGAYNPLGVSWEHVIDSNDTYYFALTATAFSQFKGEDLAEVVQAPYDELLPLWLDGEHTAEFLQENLPRKIEQLVTRNYLESYAAGTNEPTWFYDALREAATYDYAPKAPLRLFYGTQDTTVIPKEAEFAFNHMRKLGGKVRLMSVGPYGHDEMALRALPFIQQWLLELDRGEK